MKPNRIRPSALVLCLLLTLEGCRSTGPSRRVMILGFDGVDPRAVDLLLSEGKLPNFAKLRREGAYAPLASARPLLSPVIWTTIATGTTPDRHGIGHFVAINQRTGEPLPVTSRMRRVKALWNILSDAGRRVGVVGWWATWPAERVHGSMVSDHLCYHFLFKEGFAPPRESVGLTWPAELARTLAPRVRRPTDLTQSDVAPFVRVRPDELSRPFDFNSDLGHFQWALATAATYTSIGLDLWKNEQPDLLMVYVEGTDTTSHLFGHLFRARGLSGELAEQQARYGNAVEHMYAHADRLLGEYMAAMDDGTTLVVLSDHGFELGLLQDDPSKTRDMRRVSERYHTDHGILFLYGDAVRAGARLQNPTILDITPTVLALIGQPPATDMPGRVLTEGIEIPDPPRIATHETGGAREGPVAGDGEVDEAILEKLKSLGYIGGTSPSGERNLAAVLFEQGRFEEAVAAYEKLIAEDPNDAAALASLAGALGALGRYDAALEPLDQAIRLEPLNPEAYHNRGVIFERKGDVAAAIREYSTALRYVPDYEASRQALARLGVQAGPSAPATDAERLAFTMAQAAAEAARRGAYDEASAKLDEAERIAPRYALVHQYRSNVAYLAGDREAAIRALERGLEIEPDNALFRLNLAELERAPAGPAKSPVHGR